MPSIVEFQGIETTIGCEFCSYRGAYPSPATLWFLPQPDLDLPLGTLKFTGDNGKEVIRNECAADVAFLRKYHTNDRWRWSIQIFDRRHKWKGKTISGRFNVRLSNGTIPLPIKRSARELFAMLFSAAGNPEIDVSAAPANVYPLAVWDAADVQAELTKLCAMTACEICPQADDTIILFAGGVGETPEVAETSRHPEFKHKPRRAPAIIEILCGPDIFQSKFALQAIGREVAGDHALVANLTYRPQPGWFDQHPYSFSDVSGDPQRAAAFDSVWRYFRAYRLAQGGLTPAGCEVPVFFMHQMLPFYGTLIEAFFDLEDFLRTLPCFVDGEWWEYGDAPDNGDFHRMIAPFSLVNDWGIIQTLYATFKLSSGFYFIDPELYLTVAFHVRDISGAFVRLVLFRGSTGDSGTLTLFHPEIFRSFRSVYNDRAFVGLVTNVPEATAEADAYLDLFVQKFADPWCWEMEYADIQPLNTNGKVTQVKWTLAVNRQALTHISVNEEFDVYTLSAKQREVLNASR